jgi:hypothetical protein
MFSKETGELILRVVTSWQVIAVTVVLGFYLFLVSSAARLSRKRGGAKKIASAGPRKWGPAPMPSKDAATRAGEDELGLEEESGSG